MKVSEYYKSESKWLKAEDLGSRKHKLRISDVEEVDFEKDGKKVAVRFEGREKGLVLNVTNAKSIAKQHGDDWDNWPGKEITIFPTTTDFNNKEVPCIRIEEHIPEASEDDDIPF